MREKLTNKNARNQYEYRRYYVYDLTMHGINLLEDMPETISVGRGKYARTYRYIYCGFDIETYTTNSNNGYMYIWQFSINNNVIIGRTWEQFVQFLDYLIRVYELDSRHRLLVWVANLSYEFQFMRKWLEVTEYFFKEERKPLKITHNNCIDFMDCLPISGGNLDYLAKTFTNTQKCINDLDYTIPRNSKTLLSDLEMSYCDNDVLILSEWSEYYFHKYIENGFMPVTIQSVLRKKIKDKALEWHISKGGKNKKTLYMAISSCQPSEKTYKYLMKWCFRGGYVHGNISHVNELMCVDSHIMSFDLTSSYPAQMEHGYYPSRLYTKHNVSTTEYLELIKKYCVIATIKFTNVKAKLNHSIESESKCIELINPIIDNGRVLECDSMTVCITELDFRVYNKFYEWDSFEIINCLIANRIKLPDYVLDNMEGAYTIKDKLKKSGKKYDVEKVEVNSYFGVLCTRQQENDVVYENEEYSTKRSKPYNEQIMTNPLLAQWGIYVTSWARYVLLSMVATIGNDVLYCDTDSIKFKNCFNHLWKIEQFNHRQKLKNKALCERKNLPYETFHDLGCFDYEGKCINLKYLGAKRYIYTTIKKGKLVDVQTIAGLPKNKLINLYPNRQELYDNFKDDMILIDSDKLYAYYNDDEVSEYITDKQGHTVLMTEKSNVGLSPTSFKLNLDKVWMEYFINYQEELKNKEKR